MCRYGEEDQPSKNIINDASPAAGIVSLSISSTGAKKQVGFILWGLAYGDSIIKGIIYFVDALYLVTSPLWNLAIKPLFFFPKNISSLSKIL